HAQNRRKPRHGRCQRALAQPPCSARRSPGCKPGRYFRRIDEPRREGTQVSALSAVVYREMKIRATNFTFIFWDLFFPLLYMLVFGVGVNSALGAPTGIGNVSYNEFFLAGVLAMASFAIASNTSWSFFLDRDNGIFYEMLTYPMRRSEYLLGKVLFNVLIAVAQAALNLAVGRALLGIRVQWPKLPLLLAGMAIGTAGRSASSVTFCFSIRRNGFFLM